MLLLPHVLLHPSLHPPPSAVGVDFSLLKAPGTTSEAPPDSLGASALKMGMVPNQVILRRTEISEASNM